MHNGDHHLKKTTVMPTSEITALFETPMLLGECPVWHPEEGSLYWIDIAGRSVHRYQLDSKSHASWPLPSEPGCITRCASGGMVVAMRSGISILDPANGALIPIADAPYDTGCIRFNDGRCDAHGRLWVGTLYDPRDKQAGTLYCLDRGTLRDVGQPVTVSNGVAFSTDNRVLYHADTTAHRINAYDFDAASGRVEGGRLFKQFSSDRTVDYGGRPDGAAVDIENAYWCAMYEGGRLLRLAPDGVILEEIPLPLICPTMIAFGGDDLCTLFITSARHNRPEAELQQYPFSGCVLQMRVDVPGRIEYAYQP